MTGSISQIQIFETQDGLVRLDVHLQENTVWLNQSQMVTLFGRDQSVIARHIRNIFVEDELEHESVHAKLAYTAEDGKTYQVDYYNLDVIISVGYRVKSIRGVLFRKWATQTLKQHLVQGYALNQQRFEENAQALEKALELV